MVSQWPELVRTDIFQLCQYGHILVTRQPREEATSDYDAIVVGAGHNGLTAAAVLQRAGLRTLCLEANTYAGGMAATVELIDGFHYEIAGSVQFPTASQITKDLGLDTLPTVEPEVMSTNIGDHGEEPMIFYRDPMQLMTHLGEKHGIEAVTGLAELIGWSTGPAKALGRFDVRTPPKTLDEMYACAANAAERRAIHEMLFGSAMDVIDRYLPDKDKHAVMRGMLAFLAVNSTYRGPYTPGSATCLAFALAVPDDSTAMMTKLKGGIGALTEHLRELFVSHGGEIRFRSKVEQILVDHGAVTGVRLRDGSTITAPIVVSNLSPDVTLTELIASDDVPAELISRLSGRDHRASFVQIHFALDGLPEFAAPYEFLNEEGMQQSVGIFGAPEEQQLHWESCRRGIVPDNPSMGMQIPSVHDPGMAPPGKHAASAYAYAFPVEVDRQDHGRLKNVMAQRVIDKITRLAPNFKDIVIRHITFAPYHMNTMFGAPAGDFCHGLLHPDLMGPNRPGPKGFLDFPIPIDGLYLGGAGCHGGPGITFTPGYNAGYQALDDMA
ncbi:MAG: phytoene desaturase family protein [Mycobacterium sp.]